MHLLVQNPMPYAKKLDVGVTLGKAQISEPSDEVDQEDLVEQAGRSQWNGDQEVGAVSGESRSEVLARIVTVGDGIEAEKKQMIDECVLNAHDVFALSLSDRSEVEGIAHEIDTGQSPPICQPPRHVPFALRPKIKEMVAEMLEAGVIQELNSPWASPVVLV